MFRLLSQSLHQAKSLQIYIKEKYWYIGTKAETCSLVNTDNFSLGSGDSDPGVICKLCLILKIWYKNYIINITVT